MSAIYLGWYREELVACGKVFEAATVLHGMQLAEDEVKVTVEEVLMPFALVPMPTDEVYTVAQAFKCFLAWPRDLVDTDPRYRLLNPQIYYIFKFTCLLYSNLNYIPF